MSSCKPKTKTLTVAVVACLATSMCWGVCYADGDKRPVRLDLSVPEIPAFTALGASPTQVSRPGALSELGAAVLSGLDSEGQVKAGTALEVAPIRLILERDSESWLRWVSSLRLSFATVGGSDGGMDAAVGARYGYNSYDPDLDEDLRGCLTPSSPRLRSVGDPVPDEKPNATEVFDDSAKFKACREHFRNAHLAQTALDVAYVGVFSSTTTAKLDDLAYGKSTVTISLSLGINLHRLNATESNWAEQRTAKDVARLFDGASMAIEPTFFFRVDAFPRDQGDDYFGAIRVPLLFPEASIFLEGGYRSKGSGVEERKHEVPVGIGGDFRLSSGTWVGLYASADAISGEVVALSNLKWSFGEDRPF